MPETIPRLPGIRTELIRLPGGAAGVWLLRGEGALDSVDPALFRLAARPPADCGDVAVDLSLVHTLTAAGAAGLRVCAAAVTDAGRRLFLCGAGSVVTRVLGITDAVDRVTLLPDLDAVLDACLPPGARKRRTRTTEPAAPAARAGESPQDIARLRAENQALRGKLRSYPLISRAQGILQERYALQPGRSSFDLLRTVSQRHNIPLRTLAAHTVAAAPPRAGARRWFPGRTARPQPRLGFLDHPDPAHVTVGTVMRSLLAGMLTVTAASRGDIRLTDPATAELRIQCHRGLSEAYLALAHTGATDAACGLAADTRRRVTVTDNLSDPAFTDQERALLEAEGCHGTVSTPLLDDGDCVGVASVHMERPCRPLSGAQAAALDEMCAQTGRWLAWHRDTGLLDALEHLHQQGLVASGRGAVPAA